MFINDNRVCQVKTDEGSVLNAIFAVKPASDIIASHFMKGDYPCVDARYPSTLQPRDREALTLVQQVNKMASNLKPDELGASVFLNQGAPIVRSDGVVLNGNGRTMAIVYAYTKGYKSADKYRRYLVDHAAKFGLTSNEVLSTDKPILVREIVDDISDDILDETVHSTLGGSCMSS